MTSDHSAILRKCYAAVMAAALVLQPLSAYAAPITTSSLAEVPLQGLNPVKPNIMYTMDESGSMALPTLPDYITDIFLPTFVCRNAAGGAVRCTDQNPLAGNPPLASSKFNKIYYDPTISYSVGNGIDASGNTVNLPFQTAISAPWTAVYIDGFAGYPSPNSGATIDLTKGYPDEVFCWKATTDATELATAKTDGSVCRSNGKAYNSVSTAGYTTTAVAAGYNYPNTSTSTCTNVDPSKCVFGTRQPVTDNPYYYTLSNVRFCPTSDANGWGDTTNAACGTRWTPTNKFVSYGAGNFDPAAFVRIDIVPATPSYPSGRDYAHEMDNFAKWYAFARTRILANKTAGGIAFSALDESSRVGFNTLNTFFTKFLNVADFNTANKITWFNNFYSVTPVSATPSIDAMWRIGEYFSNRGAAALLANATDPLDPVTGKCQPNYHLMSTDGYSNQGLNPRVASTIGNQDRTVPASLPGPIPGFTPGQPFPLPYREGATATSNTMADVAMYYWIHDIRPDVPNQVKDTIAPWQHVTFYGLAIGAEGTLPYPSGINDIASGATAWPTLVNNTPSGIDDLWHAAVNSRGKYFNAQNAQQLAESIVSALSDFSDQAGTGTAVGIAGAQFSTTQTYGYRTSYEIGWWGDVRKYALDPNTGALPVDAAGNPQNAPLWSAAPQLDTLAAGTGWDTNRRIVTINDSSNAAVPFRLGNLSAAQATSLNAGWSAVTPTPTAQAVLNFLRGDNSNEGAGTSNFRIRTHVLGDLVYSGAVPVGAPNRPYDDAGNPGYSAFALAKMSRTPAVYVGGNDGMLHAFDDSTTANAGKETWAFVPKALYSADDPNRTGQFPPTAFQLGALSYRRGGIPLFRHKFYVNATPRIWDVDFANTNTRTPPQSGNNWHTMLVGGLGAGGRAVYALDVTTPVSSTESEAEIVSSGRVLWEFTDANLGYVFDAPTLVKTKRYGWVTLVASGYNNPGGKGILYVLNPTNGNLLQKLSTGVGTDADPSDLSTIRAFTASRKDPYVLQAYGGDLKGNVWRFDLSDPDESKWKIEKIAQLTDPSGRAQPITTGVRIEIDQNNFVDRYIFVGTGKLLDQPDLSDSSITNTLYVIRDGTVTAAGPAPATPYSRGDLNSVNGALVTGFAGAATGRGWYQDASSPNEKIGTDVFADVQTVVYSFSKPSTDPCEAALTSNLFARDLLTGNSVIESTGGDVVASISDIGAIAGVALIQGQGGAAGASSGDVRVQVTTMKGQVLSFGVKLAGGANTKHRVSWRLLNRD